MAARAKFLVDAERCIECNACVTACKNEHEVPWGINRAPSAHLSSRRRATSDPVARWTNVPSAPVAPKKTTPPPNSRSMAATGSRKANCRSAPRCAPPRRFWPVTAMWSRASTASVSWRVALAPVHGAGEQHTTKKAADRPLCRTNLQGAVLLRAAPRYLG